MSDPVSAVHTPPHKLLDGKTLTAVIGVMIGVGGLALNLGTWVSERPNLAIRIESVTLQSEANLAALPEQLAKIEEKHGHVTGNKINNLRTAALAIDPSTKAGLDDFANKLQDVITFFVNDSGPMSASAIRYSHGILTWPDGMDVDLRTPEGALVFPTNLVAAVRRDPDNVAAQTLTILRETAFAMYGADKSPAEGRAVAEDLRRIRTSVRDVLEGLDKKVLVKITIENRSKLPTFVQNNAMLRVFQDQSNFADIGLSLDAPGFLEGYSIKTFQLVSRRATSLRDEDRRFLDQAVGRQDKCVLVLQDLHSKLWEGGGRVSDSNF